jgi:hypothetical protein
LRGKRLLTSLLTKLKNQLFNELDLETTLGFSDLFGGDKEQTMSALDLGGGSTQITFTPTDQATLDHTKSEFLRHISAFHHNLTVYTQR